MPIPNFDFPGVTLTQHFESSATSGISDMSVACVGQQYKTHRADNKAEAALLDQSKVAYSSVAGLSGVSLPGVIKAANVDHVNKETQRMVIKNGKFSYCTADASNNAPTVQDDNKISFAKAVSHGDGFEADIMFLSRGVLLNDTVIIKKISNDGDTPAVVETVVTEIIAFGFTKGVGFNIIQVADFGSIKSSDAVEVTFCVDYDTILSDKFSIDKKTANVSVEKDIKVDIPTLGNVQFKFEKGDIYIEYRECLYDFVGSLGSVSSVADITNLLGDIHDDNPLALDVYFALAASNDNIVYFTGVRSDDRSGYVEALDFLEKYDNIYSIVLATTDIDCIQGAGASVVSISEDEDSKVRRTLWYGINTKNEIILANELATVNGSVKEVDSVTYSDIVFTKNIFIGEALVAGDVIIDAAGKEYVIESTNNLNTATVEGALSTKDTAALFKFVRKNPRNTDIVKDLISQRVVSSYRAQCVWGDGALFNGAFINGHALAAAAAGMRSGEACHRPISNIGYTFFSLTEPHGFTRSELKELGANGIWIIGNNTNGIPSNLRQVTSAASGDINKDEESIIANIDNIAITISHTGEDLVGNSNINPELVRVINTRLDLILNAKTINMSNSIYVGPQLLSYTIDDVYQDEVNRDHIYASITVEPPKPFNKFAMTMRVI